MTLKDEVKSKAVRKFLAVLEHLNINKFIAVKEFGNDFNETLDFANRSINRDKVTIIKVTIPEDVYNL